MRARSKRLSSRVMISGSLTVGGRFGCERAKAIELCSCSGPCLSVLRVRLFLRQNTRFVMQSRDVNFMLACMVGQNVGTQRAFIKLRARSMVSMDFCRHADKSLLERKEASNSFEIDTTEGVIIRFVLAVFLTYPDDPCACSPACRGFDGLFRSVSGYLSVRSVLLEHRSSLALEEVKSFFSLFAF